jgi:hypothetical protein
MELFGEYIFAVLKYWKLLVIDVILAILSAIGTFLGQPVPLGWPLTLIILFIGLIIAQYLAYRDIRKEKTQLDKDLIEAKKYEAKSQRIEIISKEKYPSEILRILDDMRRCISAIIESSDEVKDITAEKLAKCTDGDPHELYKALNQKTLDDNINITFAFYRKCRQGIGLIDLQEISDKWKQSVEELETIKKDIPDQRLKDSVMAHYMALNGEGAIRLFYRYLRKHGATDLIIRAVEPYRPAYGLLDQTMTRVTKRILELKLGEEPKWEMKYLRSDL